MKKENKNLHNYQNISDQYNSILAVRLRNLLQQNNATQKDLSEILGVTRQAISGYCNGSSTPSIENLIQLADYFNVSIDYLLGRVNASTTNVDVQIICEKTGLSEKSINTLHSIKEYKGDEYIIVDQLISNDKFCSFIENIFSYVWNEKYNHYKNFDADVIQNLASIYNCQVSEIPKYLQASAQLTIQSIIMSIVKELNYFTN